MRSWRPKSHPVMRLRWIGLNKEASVCSHEDCCIARSAAKMKRKSRSSSPGPRSIFVMRASPPPGKSWITQMARTIRRRNVHRLGGVDCSPRSFGSSRVAMCRAGLAQVPCNGTLRRTVSS
jgi:hypothetical protein